MKNIQEKIKLYEFFRTVGYCVLPRIFSDSELEEFKRSADSEYFHRNPSIDKSSKKPTYKLYKAYQTINSVKEMAIKTELLDWLELFLGPNIILSLNRHNHVSTNSPGGNPDPIHRDHGEWTRGLITAVIYSDDAKVENGCTYLIPGSHLMYSPGKPIGTGYWMSDMPEEIRCLENQSIPIPMTRGSVLLFDSHILHGAGKNNSSNDRLSIVLGYHSTDQLSRSIDDQVAILVRGEQRYRGNN